MITEYQMAFYVDLYRVKVSAIKRGDFVALKALKKAFPDIFKDKWIKRISVYLKLLEAFSLHSDDLLSSAMLTSEVKH